MSVARWRAQLTSDPLPDGFTRDEPNRHERLETDGVRAVTANGVLGSPRLATSAAGRPICDALGEEIAAWIARSLA